VQRTPTPVLGGNLNPLEKTIEHVIQNLIEDLSFSLSLLPFLPDRQAARKSGMTRTKNKKKRVKKIKNENLRPLHIYPVFIQYI